MFFSVLLKIIRIHFLNQSLQKYLSCTTAQPSCEPYFLQNMPPVVMAGLQLGIISSPPRVWIQPFLIKTYFLLYANINHHLPLNLNYYFHFQDNALKPRFSMVSQTVLKTENSFVCDFTPQHIFYWEIFFFSLVIWLFLTIKPIPICALNYTCINLDMTSTELILIFFSDMFSCCVGFPQ